MFLQISTTNRCMLGCKFCFGKYPRVVQDMSIQDFTNSLKFYTGGVRRISNVDITPIVGDFFSKKKPLDYLRLLEKTNKVEHYDTVTNLLGMSNQAMDYYLKSNKTQLFISIYGHDRDTYLETTGKDLFGRFIERLSVFYSKFLTIDNPPNIVFYLRHAKYDEIPESSKVRMIINGLQSVRSHLIYIDESSVRSNYTWAGQLEVDHPAPIPEKRGICLHAIVQTCVHPDGDITLCGLVDYKKKMIIGNVYQQFEDVYGVDSLYRNIIEQQNMGIYTRLCANCNEYEYYLTEPDAIEMHIEKNKALGWI